MAEQSITEQRTMPHSVELQRSAKGDYYWSLKLYFELADADKIADQLQKIDDDLRQRFLGEEHL